MVAVSLKRNKDFRRLYASGKSAVTPYLATYCRRSGKPFNRIGITVGAKLGIAVVRNRARRRIREAYRTHEHMFKTGYDIVFVCRGRTMNCNFKQLCDAMLRASTEMGVLLPEAKSRIK